MHGKVLRLVLLFVLLLLAIQRTTPESAQAASESAALDIRAFHLLSADAGWLWLGEQLYWTDDAGQRWREITPRANDATIHAVFFRDSQDGWVVLIDRAPVPTYWLARTSDGGATWQTQSLALFQPDDPNANSSAAFLYFTDAQTGWLVVKRASSSAFSVGALFKTSDGGSTWTRLTIPIGEPVTFVDDLHGWTAGGAAGDQLFYTQDGGRSWTQQMVVSPSATERVRYHLPTFDTPQSGALPVVRADESTTHIEWYRTSDGGQSWQLTTEVPMPSVGVHVPISVLNARHWMAAIPNRAPLLDVSDEREVNSLQSANDATKMVALDMATVSAGWAKSANGNCVRGTCTQSAQLMRTRDGGRSWQPITLPASVASASSQIQLYTGQGFDSCTAPNVSQMQNWFANSPYRVWNLYLGGAVLYPGCTPLTLSYLSSLAQQGWKFIPTWVGLQAPCYGDPQRAIPRFSNDPMTAFSQGASEADSALDKAASIGLATTAKSGLIIYFDLEYFDPTNSACRDAAKSFISGWTARLRARGNMAGVYGHFKLLSDYATIGNVPDDVWIAQWNTPYAYDANASVFNIPNMDNSLWANQQRLHQYTGGHDETWGNATINIDSDVLDGAVATLPCYTLSVSATPSAGGSAAILTNQNCVGGGYIAGTNVQVQANLNAGYLFTGWTGSGTGKVNPLGLQMDGNKSVTANFNAITNRLFLPFMQRSAH